MHGGITLNNEYSSETLPSGFHEFVGNSEAENAKKILPNE
jgi:hypothetical protein